MNPIDRKDIFKIVLLVMLALFFKENPIHMRK